MTRRNPIVAIDGPVGVGKSTVAQEVAKRLRFIYIDTGAMYRAVTLKAMRSGLPLGNEAAIAKLADNTELRFERVYENLRIYSDDEDVSEEIRRPDVSLNTGPVADNVQVRARLVALQQQMGKDGGVVMEGRDISTVVFPDAEIKIYLDADPKIRAQRRFQELTAKGKNVTYEQTLAELIERDRRDRARPVGGLRIAEDATVVDTSYMNPEQVIHHLAQMVMKYQAEMV